MNDRLTFAGAVTTDGRRLRGSVRLAGQRTPRNGEYVEVDPAAVVAADASDAVLAVGHQAFSDGGYDPLRVVARARNGSMRLNRHEDGFDFETDELPNTAAANDLLALGSAGLMGGVSFEIFGLRSKFSTDPDGTRVRRITSIASLGAVTPVVDPAFPSGLEAFSKEYNDMTEPIVAPEPTPAPAPVVTPAPQGSDRSDTYRTAEAFARNRDLADLEQAMDNLIAGGLDTVARQETYNAFAAVYDERATAEAEARNRREAIALAHDMRRGRGPAAPASRDVTESEDYAQAFSRYLRGDVRSMEQFAQSISGDGTQGGFTVPDGFLARVTQRLKAYGGIASIAEEITTATGESLRWPYLDDTSNTGAIASEGSAPSSGGADLAFDSIELGSFSYASTGASNSPLKVSLELLQDSAVDLQALIGNKLAERIGRKQAVHLATGIGGSEPVGLLSKTADTMTATAVSLAGPEHIFQVDSEYRNGGNARWVMSDTTLAKLWTSQATTNEPLFQPGRTLDGKPFDVFFGYPITIDPAAGNLVAFGDIRRGYIIRRVRGIQILVDPYTAQSTRQIAYHAWARMDANIQDPNAYSVSTWASVSADT